MLNIEVFDGKNELFLNESYNPLRAIQLKADDVIRKSSLYVCGDKSQKAEIFNRLTPKDTFVLVCMSNTNDETTLTVSESAQTVNGGKAEITPSTIEFLTIGGNNGRDGPFKTVINRYSGNFTVSLPNSHLQLSGKCMKQDKKQF